MAEFEKRKVICYVWVLVYMRLDLEMFSVQSGASLLDLFQRNSLIPGCKCSYFTIVTFAYKQVFCHSVFCLLLTTLLVLLY
jgi:hypothetical protein